MEFKKYVLLLGGAGARFARYLRYLRLLQGHHAPREPERLRTGAPLHIFNNYPLLGQPAQLRPCGANIFVSSSLNSDNDYAHLHRVDKTSRWVPACSYPCTS